MALDRPDPNDIDALLARGCTGVTLPAGALAGPDALTRIEPLLARAEALRTTVFIHPGPGPGHHVREASLTEPLWWAALTEYVAQMQAAWLTFLTAGRREHPHLRMLFALLAGDAPAVTLHAYSPPLTRTGAYRLGADGELERELLSQEEELRSAAGIG